MNHSEPGALFLSAAIINFHACPSLVDLSASVTRPTFSQFSPSKIFYRCFFPAVSTFHKINFLFSHHMVKKVIQFLRMNFMDDLDVSASRNTLSYFDFFAVHKTRSVLRRKHIFLSPVSFVAILKLSMLLHPHIRLGTLCIWRCMICF